MFEIGSSLREARLRQGLDFPELEQSTKIRAKYLRALEDEQFDVLPAQTYVKGFLRSYAEYLGLDGQLYVDEYNSRYVVGEDETAARPRRSAPPNRPRVQSRVVLLTLLGIAGVAALVILAWTGGSSPPQKLYGLGSTQTQTPTSSRHRNRAVRLVVHASTGASWIRIQRDPPHGPVLYQNWLNLGSTRAFSGHTLRIDARSPDALTFKLNGRRATFPAGVTVVTATSRGLGAFRG
jgi:cytoskeleton protein RodZ